MSAHLHSTFVAGCFRCDLNRDEVVSALAEEYHEENIEPTMRAVGTPDDALNAMRRRYISDVLRNPAAMAELEAWAEARDA